MIKYLIFVSALFLAALAEEQATDADIHNIGPVHAECQKTEHVDESVFDKLRKHEKVHLPENFGKHMRCMAEGMHMMNADGTVNVEGVKTHVKHVFTKEEVVNSITRKCAVDKTSPEKTAMKLNECLDKAHVLGSHGHKHHSSESSESSESHEHHDHQHGH